MALVTLSGASFRLLLVSAVRRLAAHQEDLNFINIFPAPDGDTGDNLVATLRAACRAVEHSPATELGPLAQAAAEGAFSEARGNSGLILSQILRGFAEAFRGLPEAGVREVALAFQRASEVAYQAVARPVEGTMLTVIRECAARAEHLAREVTTLDEFFAGIAEAAYQTVARTPELLSPLKRAGVVDAGAQGLAYFLEGMWEAVTNRTLPTRQERYVLNPSTIPAMGSSPYDVEISLRTELDPSGLADILSGSGESLVVTSGLGVIKIHLHTDDPTRVLQLCLERGALVEAQVRDMREQRAELLRRHREEPLPLQRAKAIALEAKVPVIACASGEGFIALFRSLKATKVLDAMTVGPEDLETAIREVGSDQVILLPNLPACWSACEQVRSRSPTSIAIVPTRTQPQGVAALLAWQPDAGLEENLQRMSEAARAVRTGVIVKVTEGFKGIVEGEEAILASTLQEAIQGILPYLLEGGKEVLTLYPGSEVDTLVVEEIARELRNHLVGVAVEVIAGGQPDALLILSAE
ncbi:MAG: DAK2 domain-containing protein [Armatimonadota bacterium]|nr:DAK2 domain-containing protein [Armatimonadota bacterium]MDR5703501.1 DAK2 domain-containing protein [Armatimonadota bacterium]